MLETIAGINTQTSCCILVTSSDTERIRRALTLTVLVLPSWNHRQLIVWVGWTLLDSVGSQTSSQIVGINSTTVNQWELQAEGHLFFFLVLSLLPLCVLPFFPLHYILFCLHILFKIILFVPMVSPVPTSLETPAGLHVPHSPNSMGSCSPHTFLSLV